MQYICYVYLLQCILIYKNLLSLFDIFRDAFALLIVHSLPQ